jgi:hypothetical protein
MRNIKPPVLAAISAAIAAYLADEEAVLQQQQQAAALMSLAALGGLPGPAVNLWALSGRQQSMQLRLLTQRRSLR